MKLNKDTFNPKLHKVTLRGKSVNILGFSLEADYAFFYEGELRADLVDKFEVKRFRVALFKNGDVGVTPYLDNRYETNTTFERWLTDDWIEY